MSVPRTTRYVSCLLASGRFGDHCGRQSFGAGAGATRCCSDGPRRFSAQRANIRGLLYGVAVGEIPHTCLHRFTDYRQVMKYAAGLGYLCCCSCGCKCPSRGNLASYGLLRLLRAIYPMTFNGQSLAATAKLMHAFHVTRKR